MEMDGVVNNLRAVIYHFYEKNKTVLIWTSIFIVIAMVIGYKQIKARNERAYWATVNSPTKFKGDGYSITFPCNPVKALDTADLSDNNLKVTEYGCETFNGPNHSEIDNYQVESETYLTEKYDIHEGYACVSGTDPESKAYHVVFNETRERDGYQINICGYDTGVVARVLHDRTIYILSVLPSVENTTFPKLSSFVDSFALSTRN